jgi:putative peptidoglycan lipid II flippase
MCQAGLYWYADLTPMNEKPPKHPTRRTPLSNVAALLIVGALSAQILGFLRTKLVNANFSPVGPNSTDAYFAAFNIPDFFFFTVAAGALGVAFMPVLSDYLHRGDRKGMWQISSSLLNLLSIVMFFVGVIILIFAKPLIQHVVAPNLTPHQLNNAVDIMRLSAFNPLLFTISGVLTSIQQTLGRFFFYALAPLFYNLSVIVSIFVFKNSLGLVGLGVGAMVGAVLQLVVVIIGLAKTGYKWHPTIMWRNSDFRLVLKQLPPRSLDQGIDQLESIVETNFARRLGEGNVTYYNNAFILQTAPIMLIGTAISTAAFPRLTARLSQHRPDLFRRDFLWIFRVMVWIALPVAVISFFARGYLARLIFTQGSPQIALIFGYLTIAIVFRTMYTIISRWFYAQKDTKTPLFVSLFTISLNIFLAWLLTQHSSYGIGGLALAQSLVAMVEVAILVIIMLIRDHGLFNAEFWNALLKIISVTGFSVVAGFIVVTFYPLGALDRGFLTLGSKLALIAAVILTTHVGVSWLFGLEEVRPILYRARRTIKRTFSLRPLRDPFNFN